MLNPNIVSLLPKPLSCRFFAPLLTQYVESEESLAPEQQKAVAAHLQSCSSCREETEAIRAMSRFMFERAPSVFPAPVPSNDLWDRIEARIIAEERPVKQTKGLRPALVFAPAFAALVVAAIAVPRLSHQSSLSKALPAPVAPASIAMGSDAAHSESKESVVLQDKVRVSRAMVVAPAAATAPPALRQAALPTMVAVNRNREKQTESARTRIRAQAGDALALDATVAPRQTVSDRDYVIVTVVPSPRPRTLVAQAQKSASPMGRKPEVGKPSLSALPITNDVFASTYANKVPAQPGSVELAAPAHSAGFASSTPVTPQNPSVPMARYSMAPLSTGTITIVKTDKGTGVPEAAPVAEALIRSRNRRGLFGGYGGGVTAMVPSGNEANINESGVPW